MSKPWKPPSNVVPLRRARGRRNWGNAASYVAPSRTSSLSGTTVGVVLAAAACAGIAIGLGQVETKVADGSSQTTLHFSYCKWGGGTNCVVDGDTFYVNGDKVRIAGIDAPETHDYGCASELQLGEQAASQLQALLNSGAVTMTSIDRDRDAYGRLLRNVSVNGQDVGDALISAGVARAYAGGRRPWC